MTQPAHHTATVNGVRLHYVEAGSGPLVVLLHGFPEFWFSWRNQIEPLAQAGFRVVAPDQRGYAQSDKPRGWRAYDTDTLANDIAALIEALGEERAFVVGHDWGGGVAWALAALHPERVQRLAVLNVPHPERMERALRGTRQLLKSWYMFFFQIPWLPETLLRLRGRRALEKAYEDARPGAFSAEDLDRYVEALMQPGGLRGPINWYRAAVRHSRRLSKELRRPVTAPTLVVWGERDRFLGAELAEPPRELVADQRVVRLPDASHWVQHDEPDEVNRLLVEHFRAG